MDYTQLAADELIDRAYSARDEFNTLFESNDISDSTLDRMATLVDELESLQTEADSRVTFAILNEKREELARKVKKKLFLPGGLRAPSTPPALPGRGPGSPAGPVNPGGGYGVGFAEKAKDDDSTQNAGVSLAEGDTPPAEDKDESEDLSGFPVPKLLGMLRTEEKGSPKYKAAKAALAGAMKKKSTVKAQLDTPYKEDMTPARAKDVKVTKAVEPENAETVAVEKKAASSPPTLALNPNVAPIEHMPTKGFPVGDKKHPGASIIKSGTVKGLKVPREQGQVTYSEEDPVAFAEGETATKSEGAAGNFPAGDYAYVPDSTKSSTWKLRLTATPGGDPDPHIVGAAAAALSPGGFRGQKVQIPSEDLPKVKAKVAAAWKKANSDKKPEEMPDSLK